MDSALSRLGSIIETVIAVRPSTGGPFDIASCEWFGMARISDPTKPSRTLPIRILAR